jgi:hypothetical protein
MKQKPCSRRRRGSTKSVLRLPDLEHAKAAVFNSLNSADARRGYRHAIDGFVDWYCSEPRLAFNQIVVLRYRSHLETRQLAPGTMQSASWRCTPPRIRSGGLRAAQRRLGGGIEGHVLRILKNLAHRAKLNCGHCKNVGEKKSRTAKSTQFAGNGATSLPQDFC